MTAFIRQEALEKAKEIEIKADEEFAIEKSKLVRQETANIDKQYEKKFKQASMTQQITRSTLTNKSRLKLLSARQEVLDDLFEQVRGKLGEVTKDHDRYQQVSTKLILEGVYALNEEKELHARAREVDFDIVRKALQGARKEYKGVVHRDLSIDLDEENPLPPSWYVVFFLIHRDSQIHFLPVSTIVWISLTYFQCGRSLHRGR